MPLVRVWFVSCQIEPGKEGNGKEGLVKYEDLRNATHFFHGLLHWLVYPFACFSLCVALTLECWCVFDRALSIRKLAIHAMLVQCGDTACNLKKQGVNPPTYDSRPLTYSPMKRREGGVEGHI